MMKRLGTLASVAALLAGCDGGSGSMAGGGGSGGGLGGSAPAATCSLRDRQTWAAAQLNEWYLFPGTLPATLDPSPYADVQAYIDALTAGARAERKDRYFTYITSIAEENAYYSSGESAGFGVRLSYEPSGRVFVAEAFEGAPALAAGIDRGSEIVAIGTGPATLQTVASLMASGGSAAVSNALGPATAGTTRVLRVSDAAGTRDLTVTKAVYSLTPVSSRYGARILDDGGRKVGYVNLRTFIGPAEAPLRDAFAAFRAAGVTEIVFDLRYNGGGLVSIAELIGDLMGRNRTPSDVLDFTTYRASKSAYNGVRYFSPQPQSVAPTRIAFIGTGATASASELVINAFVPYLGANAALIGTNTYGKPVGQIAIDRSACHDRLRVIAFRVENRDHRGDYYDGLKGEVQASCQAGDDVAYPLGDAREASVKAALDFLAGRGCTPIAAGGQGALALKQGARALMVPDRPNTAQRDVPGLY